MRQLIAAALLALLPVTAHAQTPIQGREFINFPVQTSTNEGLQTYIYDASLTNPTARDRRITVSTFLGNRLQIDLSNVGLLNAQQQQAFRTSIGVPTFAAGMNVMFRVSGDTTFIDARDSGSGATTTFIGLTDTPSSYTNNRYLRASSGALEFRTNGQVRSDIGANNANNLNAGTVGDARIPADIARDSELVTTFVGLTDTVPTLTADMCLAVNAAGTAVILQACATGGGGGSSVTSLTRRRRKRRLYSHGGNRPDAGLAVPRPCADAQPRQHAGGSRGHRDHAARGSGVLGRDGDPPQVSAPRADGPAHPADRCSPLRRRMKCA